MIYGSFKASFTKLQIEQSHRPTLPVPVHMCDIAGGPLAGPGPFLTQHVVDVHKVVMRGHRQVLPWIWHKAMLLKYYRITYIFVAMNILSFLKKLDWYTVMLKILMIGNKITSMLAQSVYANECENPSIMFLNTWKHSNLL